MILSPKLFNRIISRLSENNLWPKLKPNLAEGIRLIENSNEKEADIYFQKIISEFPDYPEAFFQYAEVATKFSNLDEAEKRWEHAREKFPNHPKSYIRQAWLNLESGDVSAALKLLKIAEKRFPDNIVIILLLLKTIMLTEDHINSSYLQHVSYKIRKTKKHNNGIYLFKTPPLNTNKKHIFISGTPRSGTSAFSDLLNSHSKIAIFQERYDASHGYHPDMFLPNHIYSGNWKNRPAADRWQEMREKLNDAIYIGDKRPNFLFSWAITEQNFSPDKIRILHIYRDINDVALSYNQRHINALIGKDHTWHELHNFKKACMDFNINNRKLLSLLENKAYKNSIMVVDYETLLSNNKKILEIFTWLELNIEEDLKHAMTPIFNRSKNLMRKNRSTVKTISDYISSNVDHDLAKRIKALATDN
jgi:tetratricopeptide (TPR) repeat protein